MADIKPTGTAINMATAVISKVPTNNGTKPNEPDAATWSTRIAICGLHSKPNKKFFDFVINAYSYIKKSKILIVGDSLTSDIKGAIDYEIDSVWFNPQKINRNLLKPKFEITTLLELKDIIRKPEI